VFTSLGEPVEYLYYLLKGEVVAELPGANLLNRYEGTVIGEISFQTADPASATVTATSPCLIMRWRQSELRDLCRRNAEIERAINKLVSSHMARKLATN
jgi:CRP-like cAMP-binding protein